MDSAVFVGHYLNLAVTISTVRAIRRVEVTFWEEFLRVLLRKPVPALAALYWYVTRRRVRGRNRLRVASAKVGFAYTIWIAQNESASAAKAEHDSGAKEANRARRFLVQIHSADGARKTELQASISSVEKQIYRGWRLADVATDATIRASAGKPDEFIVPLRAGDRLSETALLRFAEALEANPATKLLYGDEDRIDRLGRRTRPWFKPQWNEELFLAQDYLSSAVAIRSGLLIGARLQSGDDLAALLLKVTDGEERVVHVPYILVHVANGLESAPDRSNLVSRRVASRAALCSRGPFSTI